MNIRYSLLSLLFLMVTIFSLKSMNDQDSTADEVSSESYWSDISDEDWGDDQEALKNTAPTNILKEAAIEILGDILYTTDIFKLPQGLKNKKIDSFIAIHEQLSHLMEESLEHESCSGDLFLEKFNTLIEFLEGYHKHHQVKEEINEQLNQLIHYGVQALIELHDQRLEVDPAHPDARNLMTTIENILQTDDQLKKLTYLIDATDIKRAKQSLLLSSLGTHIHEELNRIVRMGEARIKLLSPKKLAKSKKSHLPLTNLETLMSLASQHEYFLDNRAQSIDYFKKLSTGLKQELLAKALEKKFDSFAQWLINAGASIDANSSHGIEHLARAIDSDQTHLASFLIRHQAPPDCTFLGLTPLTRAVIKENLTVVKLLLEHNADPNRHSQFSECIPETPLYTAVHSLPAEKIEMVKLLVSNGAIPYYKSKLRSMNPLVSAITLGYVKRIECMLNAVKPQYVQEVCNFASGHADENYIEILEILLEKYPTHDFNYSRILSRYLSRASSISALKYASVRLLLSSGADCNYQDPDNGFTPLMILANTLVIHNPKHTETKKKIRQQKTLALLFLEHGADLMVENNFEKTVFDVARDKNNRKLVSCLQHYSPRFPSLKEFALRCIRHNKKDFANTLDRLPAELRQEVQERKLNGIFHRMIKKEKSQNKSRF